MVGARCVSASESGDVARLDEGLLKTLTGQDSVTTRLLYKEPFSFRPTFKLWLTSNEKPAIRGTDYGIWRRILIVPFDATFSGDKPPAWLKLTRHKDLTVEDIARAERYAPI